MRLCRSGGHVCETLDTTPSLVPREGCGMANAEPRVVVVRACRVEVATVRRREPREASALERSIELLQLLGASLGYPHSSAVRAPAGRGMRELRPRAGRSRYRLIYRRVGKDFVILALGPEAKSDPTGFTQTLRLARNRLEEYPHGR